MNPVLSFLRSHVSVRDYEASPVPDAHWTEILAAGQQASTDATGQLYCGIEIRDGTLRAAVCDLIGDQPHVRTAPRLLLVCLDVRRLRLLLEHRGERFGMRPHAALLFGLTDAGLFAQNVAVAAESLGLGVCFLGAVQNNSRAIARTLHLPEGVVPLYGITFGRPRQRPPAKARLPQRQVVHVDGYRDPTATELDDAYAQMKSATRSGDWLNPIRKYFAAGGIMDQREDEIHGLLADQGLDPCGAR